MSPGSDAPRRRARGTGPARRWLSDVALGARLVAAGGRDGRLRAGLTALGVGLGVALLLLAASVPAIQRAPDDRDQARQPSSYQQVPAGDTLLVDWVNMEYRGQGITGVLVQPEGPHAPVPPGVAQLPEPGELVVSPALARLLAAGDGDLLRPRLDYPIAGTIGEEGLRGPQELYYYLGTGALAGTEWPMRIDHFGEEQAETQPLDPLLTLLVIVGIVVLLVPVATFIAVAVRFGGDAFVVADPSGGRVPVDPGQELQFGFEDDPAGAGVQEWTVPARAFSVPASPDPYTYGSTQAQVLVTPGAVAGIPVRADQLRLFLELDPANPDAVEHVRNTAAAIDIRMQVTRYQSVREDEQFTSVRRGLLGGVTATLLLIGLSLLVGTVEQLRERRRLLAVLIAFGTRRRTLGWSVLWQTAIPVVLGMLLAIAAGIGLGLILLAMASYPPSVDGPTIAAITGIAAGVVLLVSLLAMPVLWRLMRPDGLRTE